MMWRLLLFSGATGGYIYLRVVAPLAWHKWGKAAAAVALAGVALRLPMLALISGGMYAPPLPAWVGIPYSCLFVAYIIWFCGVFGAQVLRGTALRGVGTWRRLAPAVQQRCFNRLHAGLLAVALLLSVCATYCGLQEPEVRHLSLRCGLPQPMRIALLTDLHVSAHHEPEKLRRLVRRTNELGADIVCITGDFVDGSVAECAEQMAPLSELRAPLGVYGVPGNHDYYSGYEEWRAFLTAHGVRMLDNAHVALPGGVILAGVTEETADKLPGMEPPNLHKALLGVPTGAPVILLSHRPDVAGEAAARGVALQLSGHTHGGLVWGIGQLVALMNHGYLSGLYRLGGGAALYVSPGTGTGSRTPLRLGVPAELTDICLH